MSGYTEDTETINILAKLLQRQAEATDYNRELAERFFEEREELGLDLEGVDLENGKLRQDITERDDEINDRHNEMMDLRDRLKTAEALASKRLQMIEFLESEIEGLNEFISSVEALVKDQDWYELRVKFGYADVGMALPVTHPEYLETEEDYESAPLGTRTKGGGYAPFERVEDGWLGDFSKKIHSHPFMAGVRLEVDRWGTDSANGLANGL